MSRAEARLRQSATSLGEEYAREYPDMCHAELCEMLEGLLAHKFMDMPVKDFESVVASVASTVLNACGECGGAQMHRKGCSELEQ